MPEENFKYCVLFLRDIDHQKFENLFKRVIPEGRGEVFYPLMEYYRRGDKSVKIRAIFQGYLFLYTNLSIKDIHEMIIAHRRDVDSWIRELSLSEKWRSETEDAFYNDQNGVFELSDVSGEETEFLDLLRTGDGLLKMSGGYDDGNNRFVVMEGPLKAFENKIVSVDKHNRKAFLEFDINGNRAQAGFNCYPKSHYFPEENTKIFKLDDGTEIDLTELQNKVMTVK